MDRPVIIEVQRLESSGARAVAPFALGGRRWLAVPQLARDAAGTPPGINGGSSDTEVLLFAERSDGFVRAGSLPVGGGEDVEVFAIAGQTFAAVASIRTGNGPYDFATTSPVFRHQDGAFRLVQEIDTFAAKQVRHFRADGADYLGVAQNMPGGSEPSVILRWNGSRFAPVQQLHSVAGYNIETFRIEGTTYLAHADHVAPSLLYRLEGGWFVEHQELLPAGGRAFLLLRDGADAWLAVARIDGDSVLLRWDGRRFTAPEPIPGGPGGREFALLRTARGTFLVRVDFIHGAPADSQPDLLSHVYRFASGRLTQIAQFPTTGGTDVAALPGSALEFAVSNGLSGASRPGRTFAADTVIYRLDERALEAGT